MGSGLFIVAALVDAGRLSCPFSKANDSVASGNGPEITMPASMPDSGIGHGQPSRLTTSVFELEATSSAIKASFSGRAMPSRLPHPTELTPMDSVCSTGMN